MKLNKNVVLLVIGIILIALVVGDIIYKTFKDKKTIEPEVDNRSKYTYTLNVDAKLEEDDEEEFIRESIEKTIIEKFNKDFQKDHFKVEKTSSDNENIYDYHIYANDIKTLLGYTIIIIDNKVTIYDNMNEYNELEIYNKLVNFKSNIDEDAKIKEALLENPSTDTTDVKFYSTLKWYDEKKDKFYFDVNLKVTDKGIGTYGMRTATFEM